MTLIEEEGQDYKNLPPGSWSRDLDRILAKFGDEPKEDICLLPSRSLSEESKVIVMGKAKVIHKGPLGDKVYRVTFHETWTRLE